MSWDEMHVVAIDTRGIPTSDLLEGYEELTCSRRCFQEKVLDNPNVICFECGAHGDLSNITKHLTIYFHDYVDDNLKPGCERDRIKAWDSIFPTKENNPGATLLTLDPNTGFPKYNVQGIAFALYKNGEYPLSKEEVWEVVELAKEAMDVLLLYGNKRRHSGGRRRRQEVVREDLKRRCHQFEDRRCGLSSNYEPRLLETTNKSTTPLVRPPPKKQFPKRKYDPWFKETCLM